MSLAYLIVDVFTDTPLQGNQLAVFAQVGSAPQRTRRPRSPAPGRELERSAAERPCIRPAIALQRFLGGCYVIMFTGLQGVGQSQ